MTWLAPSVASRPAGHEGALSGSDPTGYREPPDTTDGPVADDQTGDGGAATATPATDDVAQKGDVVVRPGKEPD